MSDTIIGALIAFASAALGAGLAAFINWRITKLSIDKELQRSIREEKLACYGQLISAYNALQGAMSVVPNLTDGLPPKKERELYTQFQTAKNHAILICDDNSQMLIAEFAKQVRSCHFREGTPANLLSSYSSALQAMREELTVPQKQLKAGATQGAK